MLQLLFEFVFKFTIPYRGSTFTCIGRISSLDNEAFYVPMEQAIVIISISAECKKILYETKMLTLVCEMVKNEYCRLYIANK